MPHAEPEISVDDTGRHILHVRGAITRSSMQEICTQVDSSTIVGEASMRIPLPLIQSQAGISN